MRNVYLFQPQYTTVINDKVNNWIPYSVGALWSYAQQFDDIRQSFTLKDLIFKRENPITLIERLEEPALCGFSCYIWNRNYSLQIAEEIKKKWPNCVIVFGGPEVNGLMSKYKFIDAIILGEGEENFVDVMRNIIENKEPSLFFSKKRLQDLEIPSPYTTGVFDKIINDNPGVMWAMTLETNRGCPYSCTFCDWGSLTYSKVKKFKLEKIFAEIDWVKNKPISYIYVADANFGMYKERDLEIARRLRSVTDDSDVDLIGVQSAKQSTEIAFEIGRVLGDKYFGVTLAMQSMNEETLESIKRKNLPINNLKNLLELSVKYQVPTYTEMILGMPHETKETWENGLCELLELGQHNSIDMWFTQLLENSELAQPESRRKYGLKSIISKSFSSMAKNDKSDFWQDFEEETEIVACTNTMSTEEMVDSYMFGWAIIQLHITGYSQIISKYARFVKNVPYKTFYSTLINQIQKSKIFNDHYNFVKNIVRSFLHTGNMPHNANGHMFHMTSSAWLYDNKEMVFDLVYNTANNITEVPSWVLDLQSKFIYDKTHTYPINVIGDYDIMNKKNNKLTNYFIDNKIKNDMMSFDTNSMRRKGLLKNNINVDPNN